MARRRGALLITAVIALAGAMFAACSGGGGGPTTRAPASSTAPATQPSGGVTERSAAVIAHRGASAYAPEHTLAAYDLALEQGADYLEQDLQLTADGVLVVMHDETLDRTARGPAEACTGLVREKTLAQLQQCDVGSWFNETHPDRADPAFVGLRIPTMEEVVERYGTDVGYYVETKAPDAQPDMEDALLELLDEAGLTDDRSLRSRQVIVQSFSSESLQRLHDRLAELPLVQLFYVSGAPIDVARLDAAEMLAIGIGPESRNVDAALITAAHERCLAVHPYTVDDPVAMTALLRAGVDGMFTNAPDVLLAQRAEAPAPPGPVTQCARS
jgi:glycerophosphoryl diester phosphodiesterase